MNGPGGISTTNGPLGRSSTPAPYGVSELAVKATCRGPAAMIMMLSLSLMPDLATAVEDAFARHGRIPEAVGSEAR